MESFDASIQTDCSIMCDQFCQTANHRKDFECQTNIQLEKKSITIQTNSLPKKDFQVQVNRQALPLPVQTMKEEISMPNIPNSGGQAHSKKRKLSSISRPSTSTTPSESINEVSSSSSLSIVNDASTSNTSGTVERNTDVDESILNSEVY